MIYYNLDTEEGMSGSPIYLKKNDRWILVGVHVGYDNSEKCNCGTGINKNVMNWLKLNFNLKSNEWKEERKK